jgi:hypothetical protein
MGDEQNQGKGLRTYLQGVPDPRRPLVGILMMLILAAVNKGVYGECGYGPSSTGNKSVGS